MLNWITLASLGTAMEAMITLLTIRFFPLFLITWIILNVTSSFFPPILMEYFYRFGYAMVSCSPPGRSYSDDLY